MATKKGTVGKILADVPEDKVFWCYGGETFKNLHDLASALERMSDEAFKHHVTEHKNDFSNWVMDVFGDTTLAKQLSKATDKNKAASKIQARIKPLTSKK
jgi:hypothetical protein